jgi:hypothetical protein
LLSTLSYSNPFDSFRASVLSCYGASASETAELLAYNANEFTEVELTVNVPLPTEDHVAVWQCYALEAEEIGAFASLKQRLPQLQFPIQTGMSETPAYRAATRRGMPAPESVAIGLPLRQPDAIRLELHPTLAGTIPVVIVGDRQDFVSLVQALTLRNEPKPVPDSMGACIVAGFINWDRIRRYRQDWEQRHLLACSEAHWQIEFQRLTAQKHLYQDRFILLSQGPYSNVSAHRLGLTDEEWQRLSRTIRLEHECTHYLTRRLLGSMRNNILDELLADYRGIVAAIGRYRSDWFLRFAGLESYPHYRDGGRLQNYRGQPPLSAGAFKVLHHLVKDAAENLERFDQQFGCDFTADLAQVQVLLALTRLTLEELADSGAIARLEKMLQPNPLNSGDKTRPPSA